MKNKSTILILFTLIMLSCANGNQQVQQNTEQKQPVKKDIPKGVLNNKVLCTNDTNLSYAAYLPTNYDPANKYPVIFFYDAHANGYLPVSKYKDLAEKYGYILIGSNNSKNEVDWNTINNISQNMMNDAESRLSIDKSKIYTSGISGGAKVAGIICALSPDIKGSIGCAAAFPLTAETSSRNFDYIGFAGNEDFNMVGMKELDRNLGEKGMNHKLVIYDGKHEWPPADIYEEAFKWLPDPVSPKQDAVTEAEKIKDSQEEELLSNYSNDVASKDMNWWRKEVARLRNEIKQNGNKDKVLQDKRMLNYVSLITYMTISHAYNANDMSKVEILLELYKLVDPENSEHAYIYAELYSKQGKADKAINSLKEAVKLGFKDLDRLQHDPALNQLKGNKDYDYIIEILKKKE